MSMDKLAILGGDPVRTAPYPSWPIHDSREEALLLDALHTGKWWRYAGDKVQQFEEKWAARHDARFALAVSSGSTALEASLCALNLQPGDEVLVPSYTFVATAASVILNGGVPVFVDIDLETFNIDLDHAATCITPKTRVIIPVHFAGLPVDMEAIKAFAQQHNLIVLEDAAHAHGTRWDGQGVGSFGDMGIFSFQASKNITAGEGGIILTNDEELLSRAFSRHTYGQRPGSPWYTHYVVSTNLRLTEWQGAVLLAQMERLEEQLQVRRRNALILDDAIAALPGLTPVRSLDPRAADRAYHLYLFRYDPGIEGVPMERFIEALNAEGIPCHAGYPVPLYEQPVFQHVAGPQGAVPYTELNLPNVTKACQETIWIRQHTLLGSEEDTRDIVRALNKVIAHGHLLRA